MSFSVDDQTPPFSFVMIEGTAEVDQEPDKGELLKWATRIAEHMWVMRLAKLMEKR